MNPEHLLQHFERISEVPDAISRLRRFILDLAVRGKLVEQDPNDEPAAELLKRIQEEKAKLVKEGKIRKQQLLITVAASEYPFRVPDNWQWVHLIDVVTKLTDGTHHSPPNGPDGAFKYITAKNIKPEGVSLVDVTYVSADIHNEIFSRCNPEKDDLLYIKDGATTGIVTINNISEPFSMLSSVALLKLPTCLHNKLLVSFLRSPFFYDQMRDNMKGAAIIRVTLKRMEPALVPLPPLAEQHRIVAKVDELMVLCDQLEAAKTEREQSRDRLVAASLHRLNSPADMAEPDAPDLSARQADNFRDHARFVFKHLPRLTTRPEHIKQLRQTILNLAVHGKLVPQYPQEDTASVAIAREAKATSSYMIRRGVPEIVSKSDLVLKWQLPSSWLCMSAAEMLRLGVIQDLKDGNHGANHPKASEFSKVGLPFITAAQVRDQTLDFDDASKIPLEVLKRLRVGFAKKDDVIFTHKGSVGRVAIAPGDCILTPQTTYYRPNSAVLDKRYLMWFMASPAFSSQVDEVKKQTTRDFVPILRQYEFFHAIPPLAEQHRIVARVDELMALCDQLEAQLTTTEVDSRRLLEAVLHEALNPPLAVTEQMRLEANIIYRKGSGIFPYGGMKIVPMVT